MTTLRNRLTQLARFNGLISRSGLWLAASFLGLMTVTVSLQVFFRYVLNNSLSWAEDLSLMLMVWATFLIVPYAYRCSLHIQIDMVPQNLPARARHILFFVFSVIVFILAAYFIQVSWDFTTRSSIKANAIPIQMKYVYAIMPISFVALLPMVAELLMRSALGMRNPADPDAELPHATGDL